MANLQPGRPTSPETVIRAFFRQKATAVGARREFYEYSCNTSGVFDWDSMFLHNCAEIEENLYLSGFEAAHDHHAHKQLRLALIVNCTNNVAFPKHRPDNISFVKVPIEDNLRPREISKLRDRLPATVALVHEHLAAKKPVLVHCFKGAQRSATVVAAYLMKKHGFSVDEAIGYVQSKKPNAFQPVANFRRALEEYRASLNVGG